MRSGSRPPLNSTVPSGNSGITLRTDASACMGSTISRSRGIALLDLFQVISLAIMQGLTEFLPISTSAHLVLPSMLFGWPPQGLVLDVAMHAGSLAAVLVYFRHDLAHFGGGLWNWFREGQADVYVRLMGQVLTATLPI